VLLKNIENKYKNLYFKDFKKSIKKKLNFTSNSLILMLECFESVCITNITKKQNKYK
jgi:hypothetical protein